MDIIWAIILFLLLVKVLTDRPSRRERDLLEAFPADRWTVSPSGNDGKWGIYRRGLMYVEFETREEAEAKVAELH